MGGPVIHRSKLFDGEDPRKIFWEVTLERRCCPCGTPASMKITTSLLLSDLKPHLHGAVLMAINAGVIKPYRTPKGYIVRTGEAFACTMHQQAAEIEAAKGPSYAIVDFDYGPGARPAYSSVILPDGTNATDLVEKEEPAPLIVVPTGVL